MLHSLSTYLSTMLICSVISAAADISNTEQIYKAIFFLLQKNVKKARYFTVLGDETCFITKDSKKSSLPCFITKDSKKSSLPCFITKDSKKI